MVIPKELRDRFDIKPGDKVSFWDCKDHVGMRVIRDPKTLKGRFCGLGLSEDLEAERRAELQREVRH